MLPIRREWQFAVRGPKIEIVPHWVNGLEYSYVLKVWFEKPRQVLLARKLIFLVNKMFHSIGPFDKSVTAQYAIRFQPGFDIPHDASNFVASEMFNRGIPDYVVKTTLRHMRSDVSKPVGNIRS